MLFLDVFFSIVPSDSIQPSAFAEKSFKNKSEREVKFAVRTVRCPTKRRPATPLQMLVQMSMRMSMHSAQRLYACSRTCQSMRTHRLAVH